MFDNNSYYHKLLNTAKWQRLRRAKLSEQPLCERCLTEGRVTAASCVHHITPVEYGMNREGMSRLAYDYKNLMSLCEDCHKRVHEEMESHGREGNKRRNQSRLEEFRRKFL